MGSAYRDVDIAVQDKGSITLNFVLTPIEAFRRGFFFAFGVMTAIGLLHFIAEFIQWINQ